MHDKSSCAEISIVHYVVRNSRNNQNKSFDENSRNSSKDSTEKDSTNVSTQNEMISKILNLVGIDCLSNSKSTK